MVNESVDVVNKLIKIWDDVTSGIISGELASSSEKSLVFHYAWMLAQMVPNSINSIDFEAKLFNSEFSDGMFVDLFIKIGSLKIALEFKKPMSSSQGKTNQTQTRVKIINDVKRLTYLVERNAIDIGLFFLMTDERPYVIKGNKSQKKDFCTYTGSDYIKGKKFPVDLCASKESVVVRSNLSFEWTEKELLSKKHWILKPIIVA